MYHGNQQFPQNNQNQYNNNNQNQYNNNQYNNQYNNNQYNNNNQQQNPPNQYNQSPQNQYNNNNNQQQQFPQNENNKPPQNQYNNQPQYNKPNNNINQQQQGYPQSGEHNTLPSNQPNSQPSHPSLAPENPKRHKPVFSENPPFVLLGKGQGIDQNEYDKIIKAAQKSYEEGKHDRQTLSFKTGREIRNTLNGQWFVFVSEKGKKFDFALSTVVDNDFLSFSIGTTMFQVCRLK